MCNLFARPTGILYFLLLNCNIFNNNSRSVEENPQAISSMEQGKQKQKTELVL